MSEEGGGGASRTTDPAVGSSAATDVSLREHVTGKIDALDRHLTHEIAALRRESQVANLTAERAVGVASQEAKDRLIAHNGLIEQMREQATHFATTEGLDAFKHEVERRLSRIENFQAMLTGGMLLTGTIGVATLVKIFSG